MYENVKAQSATASLALAATAKTKFDEFLRQQLGISDASDPATVVSALRKLYPTTAARLDDESRGMALRYTAEPETPSVACVGAAESAGLRHYQAVQQALMTDLDAVMGLGANRAYKVQLGGWRDAILAELMEGLAATQQAIDPVARDRTFYSVRKLEDYARVARLVALLNPMVSAEYRRLASTQERAAVVLRVLAGEALFHAGFEEGGSVFQVPFEDVRQRREALLGAVQRFTSGAADGSDPWADGEASYGMLLERLSEQGHQDLRAIIRPNTMARLLQVLLDKLSSQQPSALRGLASSAPIELMQLRRLHDVASGLWDSSQGTEAESEAASAPLAALVRSLDMFIKAFERPGAGARLLSLVLPAPLASLQLVDAEGGIGTVHTLFRERAYIQAGLDAIYADPGFDPMDWALPVKAERALYDINRVIDLLLLDSGTSLQGQGQDRSRLYGWVLKQWLEKGTPAGQGDDWLQPSPKSIFQDIKTELAKHFKNVANELVPPSLGAWAPTKEELLPVLREQVTVERETIQLAVTLAQDARSTGRRPLLDLPMRLYIGLDPKATNPAVHSLLPPDPRLPLAEIAKSERSIGGTVSGARDQLQNINQRVGQVTKALDQIAKKVGPGSTVDPVPGPVPEPRFTEAAPRQHQGKSTSKRRGSRRANSGKPPRAHPPEHSPHKIQ